MASSLNRVILMGTVASDPAVRQVAPMESACCFQIAVNTQMTNLRGEEYQETLVADVEAPLSLAQGLQPCLLKGAEVFLTGRLRFISWQDPMTGRRRNSLVVRAEQLQANADSERNPNMPVPPAQEPPMQEFPEPDTMMNSPF